MKELNRTTRLIIAALTALLIFIVGFLTMHKPDVEYSLKANEVISVIKDPSIRISPIQIQTKSNGVVLVDVRNADDFLKGHLENAINLPAAELLNHKSLSVLKKLSKENATVVLYGENEIQASSPCLLLRQIGFNKVRSLEGGFSYLKNPLADSLQKGQAAPYIAEQVRFDKSLLQKQGNQPALEQPSKNAVSQPKKMKLEKKPASTGGGC